MTAGELICDAYRQLPPRATAGEVEAALASLNGMLIAWNTRRRGPALKVEPLTLAEIDEQYRNGRASPLGFQWFYDPLMTPTVRMWPDPNLLQHGDGD